MADLNPIQALIQAIRARVNPAQPDAATAARAGSEELSKGLPAAVMPREAIEKKREQLRQLDAMTRGE